MKPGVRGGSRPRRKLAKRVTVPPPVAKPAATPSRPSVRPDWVGTISEKVARLVSLDRELIDAEAEVGRLHDEIRQVAEEIAAR